MIPYCAYCRDVITDPEPTLVGHIETGSGPGRAIYADAKCITAYRIIPLAEHPASTNGEPRYRDRAPFAPSQR